MDLTQTKLSRTEWNGIEIPVSMREKEILRLIIQGFDDVNIEPSLIFAVSLYGLSVPDTS